MTTSFINQVTRNILLKELENFCKNNNKQTKNLSLLDLGSGDGEFTRMLKKKGYRVQATDMASNPFTVKDNISYRKCDFNKGILYSDQTFDVVIAMEVIEHIENPWFFMDEIFRITKPGGIVFISTPNPENFVSRFTYLFFKRFVSFGPDLSYWQKSKKILLDKHRTPLFHFLFMEMIYKKFKLLKHLSNGVPPILEINSRLKHKHIGISKIYMLSKY